MTQREAIKFGKRVMSLSLFDEMHEFCEIAVKALEQLPDIKEAYNRGYKDGQEALALHLELRKEEAEPCEDCISRQAVLDRKYVVEVQNMWHMTEEIEVVNVDNIKALPPVNPQEPKTGHWIYEENAWFTDYRCSVCNEVFCGNDIDVSIESIYHFCPNCGAKMVDSQKGEVE